MTGIIYLDVDGVLNPLGRIKDETSDWKFEDPVISSIESGGYSLSLSKEMGQELQDLNVPIIWLTTWILEKDFANPEIGSRLGWDRKAHAYIPEETNEYWKLDFIVKLLKHEGQKVVWIDDHIGMFLTNSNVTKEEIDPHNRLMIICPDTSVGLTKEDMLEIRAYLNG